MQDASCPDFPLYAVRYRYAQPKISRQDQDGLYGLQGSTCEGTLLLLPFLTQAVFLVSTRPLFRLLIGWRLVW